MIADAMILALRHQHYKTQDMSPSPKYLVPIFLAGLFFLLVYAPDNLTYSDKPIKSDALVWIVGRSRMRGRKNKMKNV